MSIHYGWMDHLGPKPRGEIEPTMKIGKLASVKINVNVSSRQLLKKGNIPKATVCRILKRNVLPPQSTYCKKFKCN